MWPKLKFTAYFPDINLTGARVTLRPPAPEDWAAWAEIRGRNRTHLQPFEPSWAEATLSKENFQRRLQRQSLAWQNDQGQALLIFKNGEARALIGGMNINHICRGAAQFAALGYWIDQAHEGQGYMQEALALTLEYCFTGLGLHRVNCSSLPDNERSRNLLLRAGFAEEGFARNYIQINGAWQDHVLYGLTIEEWQARQKR